MGVHFFLSVHIVAVLNHWFLLCAQNGVSGESGVRALVPVRGACPLGYEPA